MYQQDTALARLLATDLKSNFRLLIIRYQPQIYAFALRQTGNPHDAEDIAQEAFIQAYYAMADYPEQRIQALALEPWLYKIALNIFYKRLRNNKLQLIALDTGEDKEHIQIEVGASYQPDFILEDKEALRELAALLMTLPLQYREAVNLYYFAELSYCEIAELLQQPMGTVKSNLHRGVQLLRKALVSKQKGR
ncbi:RNA polymerase sigma factor [Dictyobacter kobayashii]|uniref:ECF RNA polymerase sigma factor SigW n=1 Tax=Dictyobacter kobayashii TaxID=2014872 RepID=A0A402AQT4_9CHLR|nr:RNA polymerase sigma factor [Dictyobacter kobayashii]GCE21456.1 ECF RNA polymerase sigma factor SigW [Dictyobacter kobayashii]